MASVRSLLKCLSDSDKSQESKMTGHGSSLVRPRASLTKVTFFFFLEGEASINTGHCEFVFFSSHPSQPTVRPSTSMLEIVSNQ